MTNKHKEFSKIYDQHIDKIYRFVYLKVSSQETAQDICSETFLRCWKRYKTTKNTIENPQAFLYRIARNLVIDHYRQKGKVQIIPTEAIPIPIIDPSQNIEEMAMLTSDVNTIRLTLAKLKDDYQNVLIWHYLDDLSISEIAKMSEKSEGAVRVQLHRALEALRGGLNPPQA